MPKKISFFSLVVLIIATIDSIRNLPSSALFGSSMIFFFLLAAIIFLIPTALVAAELSATFPERGGIYYWVRKAFGDNLALCALWLQWANTMVWYPSILSFIAATLAYTINPDLAASPMFILSVIIPLFWLVTALNLFGLHTSVKVNDFCGLIGTIFPMILLIIFGAIWVVQGQPIHIRFDNLLPSWNHITTWISLVSIMAGFLGMELSGTHINEIHNPQKNFPRAILVASLFILFSLLLGSLTIAIVIPQHEISLVAGVIEVFDRFFSLFHLRALLPIMTLIIVIGNFATLINWILAPAKGFLHAAELGFLPPLLAQKNRFGAPYLILIIQAILVTVFSCIFFLIPSVSGFYWFLLALSTSLYMLMYILMFTSALTLHHRYTDRPKSFKIPYGHAGMWVTTLLGITACIITTIVSFFPPETIHVQNYSLLIAGAFLIMLSPLLLFFGYKKVYA